MISEKWSRIYGISRITFCVELLGVLSESEFTGFAGFSELKCEMNLSVVGGFFWRLAAFFIASPLPLSNAFFIRDFEGSWRGGRLQFEEAV